MTWKKKKKTLVKENLFSSLILKEYVFFLQSEISKAANFEKFIINELFIFYIYAWKQNFFACLHELKNRTIVKYPVIMLYTAFQEKQLKKELVIKLSLKIIQKIKKINKKK